MEFQKGRPKTGGRKSGTPNKATVEIKAFARSILEDSGYQKSLRDRVIQGKAPQLETLLFYYAFGKPTEPVSGEWKSLEDLVLESMRKQKDKVGAQITETDVEQ